MVVLLELFDDRVHRAIAGKVVLWVLVYYSFIPDIPAIQQNAMKVCCFLLQDFVTSELV